MKKSINLILFVAFITSMVKCTDVPLSNNLRSTVKELRGFYQYKDSIVAEFKIENDTVKYSGYKLDNKALVKIDKQSNMTVYFTDIKHNGQLHHFMSIDFSSYYITKKFAIVNGNLVVSNLNEKYFPSDDIKNFETSESFKKYILENIENPLLFEKEEQIFRKRKEN